MYFILRDFDKVIFEKEVQAVYFQSLIEGRIGILNHHENFQIQMIAGVIDVLFTEKKQFYSGAGIAQVQNNVLKIIAFPISESIEDICNKLNKIGDYGRNCLSFYKKDLCKE